MEQPTLTDPSRAPRPGVLEQLARDAASRRRFLKLMGGTGAAGTLALAIAACGGGQEIPTQPKAKEQGSPEGPGDVGILNFALTLEHLETDFYDEAVASGNLRGRARELARRIRENEHAHVETITETIERMGGKPVEKPKTNFDEIIAGGEKKILETAASIENTGVAAYLGQADKIQDETVLAAALSIHTVEARQAAALNEVAGHGFIGDNPLVGSIPEGAFGKPLDSEAVLEKVKPFMAA